MGRHLWSLCVDDFGVNYVGEEHKRHLLESLKENYEVTVEDGGTRCLGMTFEWDHENRKVHLSMPEYVPDALKRLDHPTPLKRHDQPHPHILSIYGASV